MPPWELKAVEYIVGTVLLGLALVFATDDEYCSEWAERHIFLAPGQSGIGVIPMYSDTAEICVATSPRPSRFR